MDEPPFSTVVDAGPAAPLVVAPAPAGVWVRAAALLIDWGAILVARVCFRVAARALWGGGVVDSSTLIQASFDAFKVAFPAAYVILFHWLWGQTFGKMALSIRVVRVSGEALTLGTSVARALGFLVTLATFGVGFLVAAVRKDKRALHDLIAGTRVERVR